MAQKVSSRLKFWHDPSSSFINIGDIGEVINHMDAIGKYTIEFQGRRVIMRPQEFILLENEVSIEPGMWVKSICDFANKVKSGQYGRIKSINTWKDYNEITYTIDFGSWHIPFTRDKFIIVD